MPNMGTNGDSSVTFLKLNGSVAGVVGCGNATIFGSSGNTPSARERFNKSTLLSLAKLLKKYRGKCALVDKFCVQLTYKFRTVVGINWQLWTCWLQAFARPVRKTCDKALMLPSFTHTQSPAKIARLTDILSYLSTLSTPPITTTTNIFINK